MDMDRSTSSFPHPHRVISVDHSPLDGSELLSHTWPRKPTLKARESIFYCDSMMLIRNDNNNRPLLNVE